MSVTIADFIAIFTKAPQVGINVCNGIRKTPAVSAFYTKEAEGKMVKEAHDTGYDGISFFDHVFVRQNPRWNAWAKLGLVISFIVCLPIAQADESLRIHRSSDNSISSAGIVQRADDHLQQMQVRLSLTNKSQGQNESRQLDSTANGTSLNGGLTQLELKRLAAHDIVILIDKSGSMATTDCSNSVLGNSTLRILSSLVLGSGAMSISRWNWCMQQTALMASQTEKVLTNGFTVVLFDDRFRIFLRVNVQQLSEIFSQNHPGGRTHLAQPLRSTFADYFHRKEFSNGKIKPLLIGVITDGCPNSPEDAVEAVISATHKMARPDEISVVFFLIGGDDRRGEEFAWDLSHNLISKGGTFPIVKAVPFQELEKSGLARALAAHLQ